MQVQLAYGKTGLSIDLPDNRQVTIIEPKYTVGLSDPVAALRQALQHPIASSPLAECIKASEHGWYCFQRYHPSHTESPPYPGVTRGTAARSRCADYLVQCNRYSSSKYRDRVTCYAGRCNS